jgi:hypothetical protein
MEARYTRLFSDPRGNSRFEDVLVELMPGYNVPGVEPLHFAPFLKDEGTVWGGVPPTWKGDSLHPAPRRFTMVVVRGETRITTSEAKSRHFGPGSVLLVEDTTGLGHSTQVLGDEDLIAFTVLLPPDTIG